MNTLPCTRNVEHSLISADVRCYLINVVLLWMPQCGQLGDVLVELCRKVIYIHKLAGHSDVLMHLPVIHHHITGPEFAEPSCTSCSA